MKRNRLPGSHTVPLCLALQSRIDQNIFLVIASDSLTLSPLVLIKLFLLRREIVFLIAGIIAQIHGLHAWDVIFLAVLHFWIFRQIRFHVLVHKASISLIPYRRDSLPTAIPLI